MTEHSTTQVFSRPPIAVVVQQHAEESAVLRHVRSVLVRAPHVKLHHLRRLDDRIAAHLDGLAVAGTYGTQCCAAGLASPGAGEVFACTVRAIEERDSRALDRLLAVTAELPDVKRGLLSAFGWVSARQLQGIARALLGAPDALRREVGLAACRLHRADPGPVLAAALRDADPSVRRGALRAAAELGRTDLLEHALVMLAGEDEDLVFRAACSACLLGDRDASLRVLALFAQRKGERSWQAVSLLLLAGEFGQARQLVRDMAREAPASLEHKRRLVQACGLLGDVQFVPWLIDLMTEDTLARVAGESFSLITGADLAALDLERKTAPEGVQNGPNDDPEDSDVALDEDESLPWPDRDLVQKWWQAHAGDLPAERRVFMGAVPGAEHCAKVLREGFQRQRAVAVQHLCLARPGTPMFPIAAPAWRQQRQLAPGN
ncbi:TIGR02270 family protein [Methylibium rhizosphaerae]|uniref:TIGR02270 family protein n=1 Tax=Methylibium rhizosphaerae TaxID=2570323 RepID=UPI001FE73EAD|nr:TIGR02270 family protein [Methylibium rhizosphaerae]